MVVAGGQRKGAAVEEDAPPTNIMHAAYVGAFELVKTMIRNGEKPDAPDPIQGSTPLHWACFGGHLQIARWLVQKQGADPNLANNDGCTPLLFACERGHTGVAQWLVREGGAKVNVRDDVTWQTPLHRVCFNAQRNSNGVTISDDEDLILWLVEAGADLGALDRFGNHVEDDLAKTSPAAVDSAREFSAQRSKLCEMIYAAREDEASAARDKLIRMSLARRRSTGDVTVQLSPKMEAKQRAPMSRPRSRGGTSAGPSAYQGAARASSASQLPSDDTKTDKTSGDVTKDVSAEATDSNGGRQRAGRPPPYSSIVSPPHCSNGSGGSGGGVAAPPAGAGARMGGGPPVPAVDAVDLPNGDGEEGTPGYMDNMVALFGGGKTPGSDDRGNNEESRARRWQSAKTDDEIRHLASIKVAEEALAKAGLEIDAARGELTEQDLAREGEAHVVESIRALTRKKAAGEISEEEFLAQKGQILEMEQLRREAEEEARRRAKGEAGDAGAGILTSVGQNTPPPSPKAGQSQAGSDDEDAPMRVTSPSAKGNRETYRASDIDRYTDVNTTEPSVFGPVPESVKESLAAKEALRDATARAQNVNPASAEGEAAQARKVAKGLKNTDSTASMSGGSPKTNGRGGVERSGDMHDGEGTGLGKEGRDPAIHSHKGCGCTIM